jgi:hypothetical protein
LEENNDVEKWGDEDERELVVEKNKYIKNIKIYLLLYFHVI